MMLVQVDTAGAGQSSPFAQGCTSSLDSEFACPLAEKHFGMRAEPGGRAWGWPQ